MYKYPFSFKLLLNSTKILKGQCVGLWCQNISVFYEFSCWALFYFCSSDSLKVIYTKHSFFILILAFFKLQFGLLRTKQPPLYEVNYIFAVTLCEIKLFALWPRNLSAPSLCLTVYCLMSTKRSHIPKQTYSWKLQVYLSLCVLLVDIRQ